MKVTSVEVHQSVNANSAAIHEDPNMIDHQNSDGGRLRHEETVD